MLKSLNNHHDQTIAIIPARGNSMRIKNKNLQEINKKSLLKNSLTICKNSGLFDEIIVSTDSLTIEKESKGLASIIHRRSKINSSSTSSTESVISELMIDLPRLFINQTLIYLIQCTSPFLSENDLKKSYRLLKDNKQEYNCMISGYFFNKFIWEKNLATNSWNPQNYEPINRPRSQDKEPLFIENGAFYIFNSSNYQLTDCRIHGKVGVYEMEEIRSIDIDEPKDLEFANFLSTFIKK